MLDPGRQRRRRPRPSRCACSAATWPPSSSPAPTSSRVGRSIPRIAVPRRCALCRGATDAEASALLGVESGGLAFWVAALRECFEEAGVLVGPGERGTWRLGRDARGHHRSGRRARLRRLPADLNERTDRHARVCRREGLVLAADTVHYVSHWITPELAPRRYDTRFFVTAAPRRSDRPPRRRRDHRHRSGSSPADALARHAGRRDRAAASRPSPTSGRRSSSGRPTRSWPGPHGHRRAHRAADRRVRGRRRADAPAW